MILKQLPHEIKRNPTSLLILMHLEGEGKPKSIGEIATEIGVTEAATSKGAEKLLRHNLVEKSYGKGKLGKRKTLIKIK